MTTPNKFDLTLMGLMAMQYTGAPYEWAKNGSFSFDCSGLTLKVLYDLGIFLPDMTSQDIYYWHKKRVLSTCNPEADCLVYFGDDIDHIKHIAITISDKYMIEAASGDKQNQGMAWGELLDYCSEKDARVKIRPINHRSDMVSCMKLIYDN